MSSPRPDEPGEGAPAPVARSESRVSGVGLHADAITQGEVIDGKYVIDRVIGVGGVGVVVAAKHAQLDDHQVAIKFLRADVRGNADIVARFAREAKASVKIKSEHAVRVFDVGVSPVRGPYLVMEYLEGRDLGDALVSGEHFNLATAVGVIVQACDALAVAHLHGIVHRDIKPENLFLSRREDGSEIVKVLDFGISKAALTGSVFGGDEGVIETKSLMGSPLYMSPEQMRSTSRVDHRSDIWSLGVVLYELLTGQPPFQGLTITQVCAEVLEREPKPIRSFHPDAPPALIAAVERCLKKDPTQRFSNVAELARALAPFGGRAAPVLAERIGSILRTPAEEEERAAGPDSSIRPPASPTPSLSGRPEVRTLPSEGAAPAAATAPPGTSARARWPIAVGAALTLVVAFGIGYALNARRAPAAKPAATPIAHTVVVESEPLGARVEWNGRVLGDTPVTAKLPDGTHLVHLSKAGFASEDLTIITMPGDTTTQQARVTLQRVEPPLTPSAATVATAPRPVVAIPARPPTAPAAPPRPALAARRTPAAAAPPPADPAPAAAAPSAPADCNPPFYFEGQKKVFKANCL